MSENLLIVANSEQNADMLYAVGVHIAEPIIYLRINGRAQVVVHDLDVRRARDQIKNCRVVPLSRCQGQLLKAGAKKNGPAQIIKMLLHDRRKVRVPSEFPAGLAEELRRIGIKVKPENGPVFPAREFKVPEEIKKISAALMMAEVGLAEAIQALKLSKLSKNRKLIYHNVPLTSEKLRAIIATAVVQAGGCANHIIVAGGKQACEPRAQGSGVLRPNEPIVIEIGPRSQQTGYFGNLTRTVVRGRAKEEARKLYHTVEHCQEIALALLRHRAEAAKIHAAIQQFFQRAGYKTTHKNGTWQGFFHNSGHGVGLQNQEAPLIGPASKDRLKAGHVLAMSPGLYYHDVGGVRLQDVALVTRNGARNLTKFEKALEV